jgi:hypothetical protein
LQIRTLQSFEQFRLAQSCLPSHYPPTLGSAFAIASGRVLIVWLCKRDSFGHPNISGRANASISCPSLIPGNHLDRHRHPLATFSPPSCRLPVRLSTHLRLPFPLPLAVCPVPLLQYSSTRSADLPSLASFHCRAVSFHRHHGMQVEERQTLSEDPPEDSVGAPSRGLCREVLV